jgi:hypothetical protein
MFSKKLTPIFIVFAAIEGMLLYKFMISETSTTLVTGVVVVAILILLTPYMDQMKTLQFGKDGIKVELEAIKEKTSKNAETIDNMILLSMGEWTYKNLLKINSGNFGKYEKRPHYGLETELYYLRNIGFIELKKDSAPSIHQIPEIGDQLSDYIAITENGKKYISLREKSKNLDH